MAPQDARDKAPRLTARGAVTRARILRSAADLMHMKGVAATTLEDVRAASGTSKSQLYGHFPDKDALVHEVISLRAAEVLARHERHLRRLDSFRGLELWRDAIVKRNALHGGAYGCELGSLANELADQDEDTRAALAGHFRNWQELLADGLERMRQNGALAEDANTRELATGVIAALQGGYLLAQTERSTRPMEIALDMALAHVRAIATDAPERDA
jgi:TetR/AcrR family transcriptional regulator, transcriptional repressor for nem operon